MFKEVSSSNHFEIDASKAVKDVDIQLLFDGAIAYPGREKLCLNHQLVCPPVQSKWFHYKMFVSPIHTNVMS